MTARDAKARRAQQRLAREPAEIGFALPGTLTSRHMRRCKAGRPTLHGPYLQWTRKVDGRTLSPDQRDRDQDRFDDQTRSAHLLHDPDGRDWVLKWAPAIATSEADLRRLVRLVDGLRRDGYPAPGHLAVGVIEQVAYWIQSRLPGDPLHSPPRSRPSDARLQRLVPDLLELVDLHTDRGDLAEPSWPAELTRTLERGGEGYCLHDTMLRRPDTARMLAEIKQIAALCRDTPVRRHDIVHFDFTYANVLSDGDSITGIIDWNVAFTGALQGDRAFDVATLLLYAYDRPTTRDLLWAALLDRSDSRTAALCLAHLTLRQVEWVARFSPHSTDHDRFLAIGNNVLDDVAHLLG